MFAPFRDPNEIVTILFRHPKGRFDVIERQGHSPLGGSYCIRETIWTPENDSRGTFSPTSKEEEASFYKGHLTEAEKKKIEILFQQGKNFTKIGKSIGRTPESVSGYLHRAGFVEGPMRPNWRR